MRASIATAALTARLAAGASPEGLTFTHKSWRIVECGGSTPPWMHAWRASPGSRCCAGEGVTSRSRSARSQSCVKPQHSESVRRDAADATGVTPCGLWAEVSASGEGGDEGPHSSFPRSPHSSFPRSAWERDVFDAPRRAPRGRPRAGGRRAVLGRLGSLRRPFLGRRASPPLRPHAERGDENGREAWGREREGSVGARTGGERGGENASRIPHHDPRVTRHDPHISLPPRPRPSPPPLAGPPRFA